VAAKGSTTRNMEGKDSLNHIKVNIIIAAEANCTSKLKWTNPKVFWSESMRGSFGEGANDPHETYATEGISGHASDLPPTKISRSRTTSDPLPSTLPSE
jgi:hypothetical protein